MRVLINTLTLIICLGLLGGCTQGLLYTHTTTPLTHNFDQTPAGYGNKSGNGSTKQLHVQITAKWDTNGIGEIAKKSGITEIYYADIEEISVLGGFWEQDYVHIYGK